jgi:heptaprenyl diphosphate synthase
MDPMQSHTENQITPDTIRKAVWLLVAVALNALEFFFPRLPFFPWLKPGLANAVTMIWIIKYGTADAVLYTILRSWISGFYFGFSFLTLALSLSGGITATLAMGAVWKILGSKGFLGTVGIGITGALFHNAGQLVTVYFLVVHNFSVFYQIPFMAAASVLFGSIIGIIVPLVFRILDSMEISGKQRAGFQLRGFAPRHIIGSISLLAFCLLLFIFQDFRIILSLAGLLTLSISLWKRSVKPLIHPLRFWLLFLFIFCMYSFFSFGTRLSWAGFLTSEGLKSAALQIIRVWALLEAGLLLPTLRFNEIMFSMLKKVFQRNDETLAAGIIALEYFPEVIRFVKDRKSRKDLNFFRKPLFSIHEFLTRVQDNVFLTIQQ